MGRHGRGLQAVGGDFSFGVQAEDCLLQRYILVHAVQPCNRGKSITVLLVGNFMDLHYPLVQGLDHHPISTCLVGNGN